MTHKIVGLFKNQGDAQTAAQELTTQGFSVETTDLSKMRTSVSENTNEVVTSPDGPPSGTLSNTEVSPGADFVQSIENFFNSLFGDDKTTANNYTNAAHDAETALTVHANPSESVDRVREIFNDNGAINVEEQNTSTRSANS